jgi:hypothetical protein
MKVSARISVVGAFMVLIAGMLSAEEAMAPPAGWGLAGDPSQYEIGTSQDVFHSGKSAGVVRAKAGAMPDTFCTLMQRIHAHNYLGKRVRFSAIVKTQDVSGWAGLWMRVDGKQYASAFDNMQERPIKGTTDWTRHEVVLDVADDSFQIALGVLAAGAGQTWIDDVALEVVGDDVPSTALELPAGEENAAPSDEEVELAREAAEALPREIANPGFEQTKPELDLALMQGVWEIIPPHDFGGEIRRVTKQIDGNRETVTFYGSDEAVLRKHAVEFSLDQSGRVWLFTYRNLEVLEGENKGAKDPGAYSYVYTISGNRFGEVNGVLDGASGPPTLRMWKRTETP